MSSWNDQYKVKDHVVMSLLLALNWYIQDDFQANVIIKIYIPNWGNNLLHVNNKDTRKTSREKNKVFTQK